MQVNGIKKFVKVLYTLKSSLTLDTSKICFDLRILISQSRRRVALQAKVVNTEP